MILPLLRICVMACALTSAFVMPAWAGPSAAWWQDEAQPALAGNDDQPSRFRGLILDEAAMHAHLREAQHEGALVRMDLPEPDGGFAEFTVTNSGTLPPGLQAKYPQIISLKGQDGQGRRVRVDVSPMGFQAMVFDPAGVWVVRPSLPGRPANGNYLSFHRHLLEVPAGMGQCALEDHHVDPALLTPPAHEPTLETGVVHRLYRAAVAANHHYIAAVGGGTVAGGLAATLTTINRVTEVYERDMAIQLQLVDNNDQLMFPHAGSDPFASNGSGVIYSATTQINSIIGAGNYDIGHVFTTGSGGVAYLRSVCSTYNKAGGTTGLSEPTGDVFHIDYAAHEIGHQFGANHTFNGTNGSCSSSNRNGPTAYEPGSATTILGYAGICGADDVQPNSDPYFHAASLQEITQFTGAGGNCSVNTPNDNTPPLIDESSLPDGMTIPARTPFMLRASATDVDDGSIMYSWEQWDRGRAAPLSAGDRGDNPIFRTFPPNRTGVRVFPTLATVLGAPGLRGETLPTTTRALNFRLTARDEVSGAGTSSSADIAINVVGNAGPFQVTVPTQAQLWQAGETQVVGWEVANTDLPPISCAEVDIDLLMDGGHGSAYPLASAVPNQGSANIVVPPVALGDARVRVRCADNIFFAIAGGAIDISPPSDHYLVAGMVDVLAGSGLALRLNDGPELVIGTTGAFVFPTVLEDGSHYVVSIAQQPQSPAQACTVNQGSGTIAAADIDDVQVSCPDPTAPAYQVGGNVSGLTGQGLRLHLNGASELAIHGNGAFVFANALPAGSDYAVTVGAQPEGQTCLLANATGIIADADIANVAVTCSAQPGQLRMVGGRVTGLAGSALVLQLNGGQTITLNANGRFNFVPGLLDGQEYVVAVSSQPVEPMQHCTVANGAGTIAGAHIADVAVSCALPDDDGIFVDGFEGGG